MKWMIASDIHGSAYYCEQALAAFEREGAQRLLLSHFSGERNTGISSGGTGSREKGH